MGLRRAGDDQEPRRVPVEAMDDPRPLRLVPAGRRVSHEAVDERAARVAGRRVDDDPGRLVDDEQVRVLVGDPQLHLLGLDGRRHRSGRIEGHLLPAREPVALGLGRPVDEDSAFVEEPLGRPARADFRNSGEEPVEPLAARVLRNAKPAGHFATCGRARGPTRRARTAALPLRRR